MTTATPPIISRREIAESREIKWIYDKLFPIELQITCEYFPIETNIYLMEPIKQTHRTDRN